MLFAKILHTLLTSIATIFTLVSYLLEQLKLGNLSFYFFYFYFFLYFY